MKIENSDSTIKFIGAINCEYSLKRVFLKPFNIAFAHGDLFLIWKNMSDNIPEI